MAVAIPLGGQFYQSDSRPIADQECVNFYLNIPQAPSVTDENLFVTPGLTEVATAGTNIINRGVHVFQDEPYFVNGNFLYRLNQNIDAFGNVTYSTTDVSGGIVIDGFDRVIMADNGAEGDQLCIVVPEENNQFNAYIYTRLTNTLVRISDANFDGPVNSVRYVDGYFLFTKKNSQKYFISNLRDGLTYTALDFANAEADPDNLVGLEIINNEPILFGDDTFQASQNIGGPDFPFQNVQGSIENVGLRNPSAVVALNLVSGSEAMVFLGQATQSARPAIWISNGTAPSKLSTIAIDNDVGGYSDETIENAFAWTYSQDGAQFVGFTFPEEKTFVYDFTSQEWHTRESLDALERIIPYRVSGIAEAYGELFVGDGISEKIGLLSREVFTELGEPIRRRFVTPQFDNDGSPFFVDSVELFGESGIGSTNGQGSTPLVLMSFSKNGARTYGTKIPRSMGDIGQYGYRTIWASLGRVARQICLKFEFSDPVKWVVSKVEVNFS